MQHLIAISPVLGALESASEPAMANAIASQAQRTQPNHARANHAQANHAQAAEAKLGKSNTPFGIRYNPRYASPMAQSTLNWSSEERAGAAVHAPVGPVDEATADEFRERLIGAVESGPSHVILDLAGIAYMSSRGLRALTLAQRAGQGSDTTIVLARPNETMREILAISRYDMVFRVADTIEDAIGN